MTLDHLINLIPAVLLASAAGMVGSLALIKRMSLAADAMSHVALPGLGLAILFKINPLIGGAATLFLGTLLISSLERKSGIPTETIIGVIFSLSLALGSLITPAEDLIEALFGGLGNFSPIEWLITLTLPLLVIFLIIFLKNKLIIEMFSHDLALVTGLKGSWLNLSFLLIFSLTLVLGLKFLGALLMGSLIIISAAVAKNIAWNINSMLALSALAGVASFVVGDFVSLAYNVAMGPAAISFAGLLFFTSLFLKKK